MYYTYLSHQTEIISFTFVQCMLNLSFINQKKRIKDLIFSYFHLIILLPSFFKIYYIYFLFLTPSITQVSLTQQDLAYLHFISKEMGSWHCDFVWIACDTVGYITGYTSLRSLRDIQLTMIKMKVTVSLLTANFRRKVQHVRCYISP